MQLAIKAVEFSTFNWGGKKKYTCPCLYTIYTIGKGIPCSQLPDTGCNKDQDSSRRKSKGKQDQDSKVTQSWAFGVCGAAV